MANYLGIEIGGTKLQLGVGDGTSGKLMALERRDIDAAAGAKGIRDSIQSAATKLIQQFRPAAVGIGFGGPVDGTTGVVTTSHQVSGWDAFPLGRWIHDQFGLSATVGNDCDCAALAESCFGAAKPFRHMAYVTVGTGIGGGLVFDGQLHGAGRPAVAEIGHLRPGPTATTSACTIESVASGWGIASVARSMARRSRSDLSMPFRTSDWDAWLSPLAAQVWRDGRDREEQGIEVSPWEIAEGHLKSAWHDAADDWHQRFDTLDRLTAKEIAEEAAADHPIAKFALQFATRVLGWGLAQLITLTAVECVVVGGGVSLMDERLFLAPLRESTARFVFGPLADHYQILPAALGEEVVVHGAIALAAASAIK